MTQFFESGGQSIGVSAPASVLPVNIQNWFPIGWTGWICLQSKGLSRDFSNTTVQKHQFFSSQRAFFIVQISHPHMTTGKTIALTRRTSVSKVISLPFNMLSRLVIAFPPKSKCLLIARLQFRTGHRTTDWFQIGKGIRQGCILSPCLFNLYAEYIMRTLG